jgi:hypothetical protein
MSQSLTIFHFNLIHRIHPIVWVNSHAFRSRHWCQLSSPSNCSINVSTITQGDIARQISHLHTSRNAMPRSNSDNFGDIAADLPTPNDVPTEDEQLKKRDLNTTGLPDGVRDDEREIEKEATHGGHKDDQTASTTRRRRNKGTETPEHLGDAEDEKLKSVSFRDRLRSPLGSGLKLDELRETISNGVEIQYVPITFASWRIIR